MIASIFRNSVSLEIRVARSACGESDRAGDYQMNSELVKQIGLRLGANNLPYEFPIHPILVHFTLGLFIIGIFFDIAGNLFA